MAELPETAPGGEIEAVPPGQDETCGGWRGLEETLARLVGAGIDQPATLAQQLGVDEAYIGRPRRALLREGLLAADAAGALHLTPRGESWLHLAAGAAAAEPAADSSDIELPTLEPLPPPLEPVPERTPTKARRRVFGLRLPPRLAHVRLTQPWGVRVPHPSWVRLPRLVLHRRVALIGASALLIVVAGRAGLYSLGTPTGAAALAARPHVTATATPWTIADLSTPARATPTPDADRWMVVQHTNGLGLLLRPAPASTARVVLLEDGARLHVTGGSVEQDGHTWLPVTSADGASGWVASEFLAPAR
jgi:hypothetical protein